MTAFEAYQKYCAVKLHFTSDNYDFFKYNGKTKTSEKTFLKHKHIYKKISEHRDPLNLLVANFVVNPKIFLFDIVNEQGIKNYLLWARRNESLTYQFKSDIQHLSDRISDDINCDQQQLPRIASLLLSGKICIETFSILLAYFEAEPYITSSLPDHFIWQEIRKTHLKYSPFIKFDQTKFYDLIEQHYK